VTTAPLPRAELDLPLVVTHLMKGVVYQDQHPRVLRTKPDYVRYRLLGSGSGICMASPS